MGEEITIGIIFKATAGAAIEGVKSLGSSIDMLEKKTDQANKTHKKLGSSIKKLTAAGKDVTALSRVYDKLGSSIERSKKATSGFHEAQEKAAGHVAALGSMWGEALATAGAGMSIAVPVKASIDFEAAMDRVKMMLPSATEEQLKMIREQVLDLTRSIPIDPVGVADIAKRAGQVNVPIDKIQHFVETIAKFSTAFEMEPEEAATTIGKIVAAFDLPIEQVDRIGDVISTLSAVGSARPAEIIEAMQTMSGTARVNGMSPEQTAIWMNSFIGAAQKPDEAAHAFNHLFSVLMNGDMSKKDQKELAKLGYTMTGLQGALIKNPTAALQTFFNRLGKLQAKDPTAVNAIMDTVFGLRVGPDLEKLIFKADLVKGSLEYAAKAEGRLSTAFEDKMKTTEAQIKLLRNAAHESSIAVGDTQLGPFNDVLKSLKPVVRGIGEWTKMHPVLVKDIGETVAGLFALKVGSLALRASYHLLGATVWGLLVPIRALNAALSVAGMSFLAKEATLASVSSLAKPIGLVGRLGAAWSAVSAPIIGVGTAIAGITAPAWGVIAVIGAALAATGLLVYKYWTPLKGFFSGFWKGLKMGVEPLGPIFSTAFKYWTPVFHWIGDALKSVIDWFKNLIQPVNESGEAVKNWGEYVGAGVGEVVRWLTETLPSRLALLPGIFTDLGENLVGGLIDGIHKKMDAARQAIVGIGDSVKSWFSAELGISSPSRVFRQYGRFLGSGLVMGIGDSLSQVHAASERLSSAALPEYSSLSDQVQAASERLSAGIIPGHSNLSGPAESTITFNQTINIAPGADGDVVRKVRSAVDTSFEEFRKLMMKYNQQTGRRSFGGAPG